MPLTLTLTEGVIPIDSEKEAVAQLSTTMLEYHGLADNSMTPNIIATIHVLPKSATLSGGEEFSGVWVDWTVPSFAFPEKENQIAYFKEATDIIQNLSGGKQPRGNIYVQCSQSNWCMDF